MSIQKQPDPRDLRYIYFVNYRLHSLSETEIAANLRFDSSQDLYLRLSRDGYPVCPECGTAPITGTHCEPSAQKRHRRARVGDAEALELPRAANATRLFKEQLDTLDKAADQLVERKEYLKDERFVVEYVNRADFEFHPPVVVHGPVTRRAMFGALQHPPEPLTKLIGCYALSGASLDPLFDALHPHNTSEEIRRAAERARENLSREARRLATLVRGRKLRTGRTTGEVSPKDMRTASFVQELAAQGHTNHKIREVLAKINLIPADTSLREIERLRKLDLPV